MTLNAGTVAAMGFLSRHGWTLRQFAETFTGGGDFGAVDPVVFEDDFGHGHDGGAGCKAGSEAVFRDRDPVDRDEGDPGLRRGDQAAARAELDAGRTAEATGVEIPGRVEHMRHRRR